MKITIITATYNSEKYLQNTIDSVLNQSYKSIEYIIVDGKSTDKTCEILKIYNQKIRTISEPDYGIYDALNKGIKAATGDIIGFLHSDDVYYSNNVIEKVIQTFEKNNTDSVYGDLNYVLKNDISKVIRYWKSGNFDINQLKKGWMPPHPTFFVKKEIYEKYGFFNTSLQISADYDLMLRFLFQHRISISYIPEVLVKMRIGGKSNQNIQKILQKMREDYKSIVNNQVGGIKTLLYKNLRKLPQFLNR
jgi:glycosyltransferase